MGPQFTPANPLPGSQKTSRNALRTYAPSMGTDRICPFRERAAPHQAHHGLVVGAEISHDAEEDEVRPRCPPREHLETSLHASRAQGANNFRVPADDEGEKLAPASQTCRWENSLWFHHAHAPEVCVTQGFVGIPGDKIGLSRMTREYHNKSVSSRHADGAFVRRDSHNAGKAIPQKRGLEQPNDPMSTPRIMKPSSSLLTCENMLNL